MNQYLMRPEQLFGHIFGEDRGFLGTFTGLLARFTDRDRRLLHWRTGMGARNPRSSRPATLSSELPEIDREPQV